LICVAVWEFIFPQSFVLWNLPPVSVFQTVVSLLSSIVLPPELPMVAVTVFEETIVESFEDDPFTVVLLSELELLLVVDELLLVVSVVELLLAVDELLLVWVSVLELDAILLLPVVAVLLPVVLLPAVLEELALPPGFELLFTVLL
jgi:hypothetical protein